MRQIRFPISTLFFLEKEVIFLSRSLIASAFGMWRPIDDVVGGDVHVGGWECLEMVFHEKIRLLDIRAPKLAARGTKGLSKWISGLQ